MSEEFGANFVTITDEDGNDIELEYIDALEYNGNTYMAFFPAVEEDADEDDEEEYGLILLRAEVVDGEEMLATIDDEEELNTVYDLFMQQLMEDDEE